MVCSHLSVSEILIAAVILALVSAGCTAPQSSERGPLPVEPEGEQEQEMLSEYEQAVEAYRNDDFQTALNHINIAITDGLVTAELYNLQGSIYQQQDDHEAAISSFTRGIDLHQNHADSYNNRALSFQILGDEAAAESDFRKAILLDPELALAHYNLGLMLYSRRDYAGAVGELQKAAHLIPGDSDVWFQLGLAYDRNNQPEDAIHAFTQVIDIEQGFDDQSYYLRGIMHAEQGSIEQAESDFDEAIRKGLRNADTLFYRGLMRYYREAYPLALEDLREAIAYQPQHADAHYYLSFTYARMGDQESARQHAQKALELDPPVNFGEEGE